MIRYLILSAACLLALTGCSSKENSVTGKVTSSGQPVTGGSVTFLPISVSENEPVSTGKPAAANVDATGSYKMAPGTDSGGAVSGTHRVIYSAPVIEMPTGVELQPGQSPPQSPFAGLKPNPETVVVKAGNNTIDIELTK